MYSISRRAGPLIGLAPPGSFRRIFISVIFFRIPCSRRRHLRRGCELLRVVYRYEERLGARA